MLPGKKQAELDQALATLIDMLPTLWRRMYLRLIEEGFEESQAMLLLRTYIRTANRPLGNSGS